MLPGTQPRHSAPVPSPDALAMSPPCFLVQTRCHQRCSKRKAGTGRSTMTNNAQGKLLYRRRFLDRLRHNDQRRSAVDCFAFRTWRPPTRGSCCRHPCALARPQLAYHNIGLQGVEKLGPRLVGGLITRGAELRVALDDRRFHGGLQGRDHSRLLVMRTIPENREVLLLRKVLAW